MHRLYEQEGARLLGVALRIVRQRALAEDIVHDACVNIWTRAASYDASRGSARGWIYSVVRNLALNAVRDGSRPANAPPTFSRYTTSLPSRTARCATCPSPLSC